MAIASAGILGFWIADFVQHKTFLRLMFSRYDEDGSGELNEAQVLKLLISMGLTAEATEEDPKTLNEHIEEMTSYTPECDDIPSYDP
eukprot:SAG31_NODE_2937_length_4889_cov_3.571399_4_plen_87_part_00